jgi:hypothetical protein
MGQAIGFDIKKCFAGLWFNLYRNFVAIFVGAAVGGIDSQANRIFAC